MIRALGHSAGLELGELLRSQAQFAHLAGSLPDAALPAMLKDPHSPLSRFLHGHGFEPAFTVLEMSFSGAAFRVPPLPFAPYCDADYDAVQQLVSRSFYDVRRRLGLEPYCIAPSENTRQLYKSRAADLFVLRRGSAAIAFASAFDGTVDSLCVDDAHRGQGLGAALCMHCVNHILQSGRPQVRLSVMECNAPAVGLYRSLGFSCEYKTYFFRKSGT